MASASGAPGRSATGAGTPGGKPAPKASPPREKAAAPDKVIGHLNPLDLVMPPVLLTDQQAATCLVKVGDQFPDLKLPSVGGEEKTLKELYGARLTLIAFWKESNPYALEELADLARTVGPQFEPEGVKIIGIDVQDSSDKAQGTIDRLKIPFPILLDVDGKAFQQLATGYFPRTYAVDATGKIVWFDIEYSRSTRRDLRRAMLTSLHTGQ
jgi:peroxiredoxin